MINDQSILIGTTDRCNATALMKAIPINHPVNHSQPWNKININKLLQGLCELNDINFKQAGAELGQAQHNWGWVGICFGLSAQFEIYVIQLT